MKDKKPSSITKIVITGGPCGGKTAAMSRLKKELSAIGYTVLIINEVASDLITGGVAPWTCKTKVEYQKLQLCIQLEKERVFLEAAKNMNADKILIICDRGAMDSKAYIEDGEFEGILKELGRNEIELRDSYDAVFHLVTAAKGAEKFYSTSGNSARTETPEQAAALDDATISAWVGHPHLRIIDNSTDFEGKINRLVAEIMSFLGEPEPLEIERKFLIEYPGAELLENNPFCKGVEIVQSYIKPKDGKKSRARRRGKNGNYIYFKTVKKRITDIKRLEIEERISEEEYNALLADSDPKRQPISKTRYCLCYDNQYFEIDVFPQWADRALLEIELSDENTEIRFPKDIRIIKEVTEDPRYKNSSLAKDGFPMDELN